MYLHGQRLWALACTLDPKPLDLKPQTLNPKSNETQARNLNPDKPPKPQALHPKLLEPPDKPPKPQAQHPKLLKPHQPQTRKPKPSTILNPKTSKQRTQKPYRPYILHPPNREPEASNPA